MLARFTIGNFLSFKSKQQFAMFAGSEKINSNLYSKIGKNKILNYTSIHGGNAAGKSNIIKAIDAGKRIVLKGLPHSKTQTHYFKFDEMKLEKSYFDYEILINDKLYAYGFEVVLSESRIVSEWLVQLTANEDKIVFTRDIENKDYKYGVKSTDSKSKKKIENWLEDSIYVDSELFLQSVVSKKREDLEGFKIFKDVYGWFKDSLVIVYPDTSLFNIDNITENKYSIADMIRELDTGIKRICKKTVDPEYLPKPLSDEEFQAIIKRNLISEIETSKNNSIGMTMNDGTNLFNIKYDKVLDKLLFAKMIFWHGDEQNSEALELHEESDGTRRMIDILMYMTNAQVKGQTLLIDEIERSIHPNVVSEIIKYYMNSNKLVSTQLIYTTHDENFIDLSVARKDTIWFVDKTPDGYSQLSTLEEFDIRSDRRNLRTDYLDGRFGGVPAVGSLNRLFSDEVNHA